VSPIPNKWEVKDVFSTNRCPRRDQPDDWAFMLDLLNHYRSGHLWASGGLSDQPAAYIDTMSLIETWVNKLRA